VGYFFTELCSISWFEQEENWLHILNSTEKENK